MKEKIKIASGQGFWGDLIDAPYHQVTKGDIDYLVMDYLAEVTMSILQKQKNKNPELGYAKDIPELMRRILPIITSKNIKVITNGGGVNPVACAKAVMKVAKELDIKNLKIGVVLGDDIKDQIDELVKNGAPLNNMETDEPICTVSDKILSANVYFGAFPIVEALQKGADIIITGILYSFLIYVHISKPFPSGNDKSNSTSEYLLFCKNVFKNKAFCRGIPQSQKHFL